MEVSFYKAECGDAAKISFIGNDGLKHHIMIDSGFERTFRYVIFDDLKSIVEKNEKIDLWVISHIHDDHIGGVAKYIKVINSGEFSDIVNSWYYNPPRIYPNLVVSNKIDFISSAASIGQGDMLYNYLQSKNKLPSFDFTSKIQEQDLFGMKIQILSPSPEKLEKLRKKYWDNKLLPLELSESESISEPTKATSYDYITKIEDFNMSLWKEDDSIENGSSISILTELSGKRILWLADSHPTDVVNTLKSMGFSTTNKLKCDWVKVTHHGSKGNNSDALYSLIECENYLMSVNGENKHFLPNKETIVRILGNKHRDKSNKYFFYFTYDNAVLRSIFDADGDEVFKKYNFEVKYLKDEKFLLRVL